MEARTATDADDLSVPSRKRNALHAIALGVGLLLATAAASSMWVVVWGHHKHIAKENGVLEWAQAGMLIFGALWLLFKLRRADVLDRLLRCGLALLYVSMAAREIEVRDLKLAPDMLVVEQLFRMLLAVLWVLLGWAASKRLSALFNRAKGQLISRASVLLILGLAAYASSRPFGHIHSIPARRDREFVEELIEFNAAILLLAAATLAPACSNAAAGDSGSKHRRPDHASDTIAC